MRTAILLTYGDLLVAAVALVVLVLLLVPGWGSRQRQYAEDRQALREERKRIADRFGF